MLQSRPTPDVRDPRAAPGGASTELDGLGPGDHGWLPGICRHHVPGFHMAVGDQRPVVL